ncbi:MAG: hypothetical protein JNN27_16595 [Planctomycetes bacterium]|nr:hypothetical protein [Planctomycetota bacterium]
MSSATSNSPTPARRGIVARFFAWLRSMLRKRDNNGGTPPNIYPLY